jgi:proteic killer suppression protein
MIHSFACAETEALFHSQPVRRFKSFERVARRKLLQLHAATVLESLRIPPGNHLEALKDDRKGQHSIRINDQWRVCFFWKSDGAHQVEIADYH